MRRDDERLERYFSGEIDLNDLPSELKAEEARLRVLLSTARSSSGAPEGFAERIMRQIEVGTDRRRQGKLSLAWRWMMEPRSFALRPVVAAGAVAVLAGLLIFVPTWRPTSPASPPVADEAVAASVTRFVLVAPQARSVRVTGDFVAWSSDGIALRDADGAGVWTVDVPLAPGVYQYTFVLDGTEWVADPDAVTHVADGFGRLNSVLVVSGESEA